MNELEQHDTFAKQMQRKYPYMFSQPYGGFAIGAGWYPILEALCANIEHHVKWRRDMRARDLRKVRAKQRGLEALIKFHQGKSQFASDWAIERAEEDLENDISVEPYVHRVIVQQIKEKFGGLRFYYQGGDREVSGMVRMAESWADRTCETCGEKGQTRHGGWVRTLCDKHEAEYQARKSNND